MYEYIYIYMYMNTYTYLDTCIYIYTCTCIHEGETLIRTRVSKETPMKMGMGSKQTKSKRAVGRTAGGRAGGPWTDGGWRADGGLTVDGRQTAGGRMADGERMAGSWHRADGMVPIAFPFCDRRQLQNIAHITSFSSTLASLMSLWY